MYAVSFRDRAKERIEAIDRDLSDRYPASDVVKVLLQIAAVIERLGEMPTRHRRYLPPLPHAPNIRCAPAGKYVVYFEVDEEARLVTVLDVQHRHRDPGAVRQGLR